MVGRRRAAAARTIGGFHARERAGPRDERNRRGTARRPRAARALRRRLATVDALEAATTRKILRVPAGPFATFRAAAARLRPARGARRVQGEGQRAPEPSPLMRPSLVRRRRIARAIRPCLLWNTRSPSTSTDEGSKASRVARAVALARAVAGAPARPHAPRSLRATRDGGSAIDEAAGRKAAVDASPTARAGEAGRSDGGARVRWLVPPAASRWRGDARNSRRLSGFVLRGSSCASSCAMLTPQSSNTLPRCTRTLVEQLGVAIRLKPRHLRRCPSRFGRRGHQPRKRSTPAPRARVRRAEPFRAQRTVGNGTAAVPSGNASADNKTGSSAEGPVAPSTIAAAAQAASLPRAATSMPAEMDRAQDASAMPSTTSAK